MRYSDIFFAMYFDGGMSCTHRNHSHVLLYIYSGEMLIEEKGKTTRLHRGDCAFIRKDFSVKMTKQAWNGEQFKAIFLTFTPNFLRGFYNINILLIYYGLRSCMRALAYMYDVSREALYRKIKIEEDNI